MRDQDREKAANEGEEAYKKAQEKAEQLDKTNPIRLGLSLNFSVFYYEIKAEPTKACEIAKKVCQGFVSLVVPD